MQLVHALVVFLEPRHLVIVVKIVVWLYCRVHLWVVVVEAILVVV